jgi:pantothenate kinase
MQREDRTIRGSSKVIVRRLAGELIRTGRAHASAGRFLLGIAGPPAAGKSTFAALLVAALNEQSGREIAQVIPMDGFHLPNVVLEARGLRPLKGAPQTFDALGFVELLARLRAQATQTLRCPAYDRVLHDRVPDAIEVAPARRILVVEGNYLLLDTPPWNRVRQLLDEIWYLEIPWEVAYGRLMQRHMDGGRSEQQAAEKIAGTDAPNATVIEESRVRADRIIQIVPPEAMAGA